MHRQFISLLVAVLIGVMPAAHQICVAGCSRHAATTAQSHHHHGGAQGPEPQMAGHAMDASHVGRMGQHHGPAAVGEMACAQCCASVSATARCRQDASTPLVPTMKQVLDPPQTTAAHVLAILGLPVGDHAVSSVDTFIGPPVSLARLTSLRI